MEERTYIIANAELLELIDVCITEADYFLYNLKECRKIIKNNKNNDNMFEFLKTAGELFLRKSELYKLNKLVENYQIMYFGNKEFGG